MWEKKRDSAIQRTRKPIQDPAHFQKLQMEFNLHYGKLLAAATGKSNADWDQQNSDAEQALRVADEMIKMEPSRGVPWTCRCLALSVLFRYPEALVAIDQAIEIDPKDTDKWDLRENILKTLGRTEEVKEAAVQAARLRKRSG